MSYIYREQPDFLDNRNLGGQLEVEPVEADDLGDWYSDYER